MDNVVSGDGNLVGSMRVTTYEWHNNGETLIGEILLWQHGMT